MRKNGFKILSISLLLSSLCLAGCSCSNEKPNVSEIKDGNILSGLTKDASDYSLLDIYNAVIASDAGNKAVANKLVDIVATTILKVDDGTAEGSKKEEYDALVDEKVKELKKDSKYFVNGKFSEELFLISLQAEGYEDEADYIDKVIRVEVLSKLLKERYIAEETLKNSKAVVTNKKIREVEYISVSSSIESTYKDYKVTETDENDKETKVDVEVDARDFMRDVRKKIVDAFEAKKVTDEDIDFAQYASVIKTVLEGAIDAEAAKIKNAEDYSQELAAKYTANYTRSVEDGVKERKKEIEDLVFNKTEVISSDSDKSAIVSETITNRLLNLEDPEKETKRAIKIGDWYYLVSLNAGTTVDVNDILLTETSDSSTYTYSIVRFKVVNADNYEQNKDIVHKVLAEKSTLANTAVSHYLKQYKNNITINDDVVYAYLKTLYPDVFTD